MLLGNMDGRKLELHQFQQEIGSDGKLCGLCCGGGFIGTGKTRRTERFVIRQGRLCLTIQSFAIHQPCPACGGTGLKKKPGAGKR